MASEQTITHWLGCGCMGCMGRLGNLTQAVFAHLVDRAGGFVHVSRDELLALEKSELGLLSCELMPDGGVMVRIYNEAEARKEMERRWLTTITHF